MVKEKNFENFLIIRRKKSRSLTMQLPLTSATSEGGQAIFSKNTFLKSKLSNKKDEVCHGSKVKIFTTCLCTGEGNYTM